MALVAPVVAMVSFTSAQSCPVTFASWFEGLS